jgi:hypothetical protein
VGPPPRLSLGDGQGRCEQLPLYQLCQACAIQEWRDKKTLTVEETMLQEGGVIHPPKERLVHMSKGSPLIAIRLPGDSLQQLDELIAANNATKQGEPWTRSSWVRDCVVDKVFHQWRARFKTGVVKADVFDQLFGVDDEHKDS